MRCYCETVYDSRRASDLIYNCTLRYLLLVQNSKPLELASFRLLERLSKVAGGQLDNLADHSGIYNARQRLFARRLLRKLSFDTRML